MSNYSIDFSERDNKIIINYPNGQEKIDITNFRYNNGNYVDNIDNFINNQQELNYLDSLKDGTNVFQLNDLIIYPYVSSLNYKPTFPDSLDKIKKIIFKSVENYLHHTTWIKVKKGSKLDPPKNYNKCFWESGLGHDCFIVDTVKTVKTFGSYIDPLEKQNADEVWPPINNTVKITNKFMKLIGFGNSELTATTISTKTFTYDMTIGCGNACSNNNANCVINKTNRDDNDINSNLFAGNKKKNVIVNKSSATATTDKIKFIVIKEWGDKMQVILYFIYYIVMEKISRQVTSIMISCDLIVFIFCVILAIPCIYTGAYKSEEQKDIIGKRHYSILEYKPSTTPYEDVINRFNAKRENILAENDSFINAITSLINNPDTPVYIGDKANIFTKEFYQAVLNDIENIQNNVPDSIVPINIVNNNRDFNLINDIEDQVKYLESACIIVPFIKIKKGTKNTLVMLTTNSYTIHKPINNEKPYIREILQEKLGDAASFKESKKKFHEIAKTHFSIPIITNNDPYKRQYGGSILSDNDIEKLFPMDDDTPKMYYTTEDLFNDTSDTGVKMNDDSSEVNADDDVIIKETEEYEYNFQEILDRTFKETIESAAVSQYLEDKDVSPETVYTLYMYDSYLSGEAAPIFTDDIVYYIVENYINYTDDTLSELQPEPQQQSLSLSLSLSQKGKRAREEPSGVADFNPSQPLSQNLYEDYEYDDENPLESIQPTKINRIDDGYDVYDGNQTPQRHLLPVVGGTKKNKRKQLKKYRSYHRKNKNTKEKSKSKTHKTNHKTNRKTNNNTKKHNKSKNNRKPKKHKDISLKIKS